MNKNFFISFSNATCFGPFYKPSSGTKIHNQNNSMYVSENNFVKPQILHLDSQFGSIRFLYYLTICKLFVYNISNSVF